MQIYQEKCLGQIASLELRMQAIGDYKDPLWKKLRCQKIAYEKRLRDRIRDQNEKEQIAMIEAIITHLSQEALKTLPKAKSKRL